jgi:hypothetical protein
MKRRRPAHRRGAARPPDDPMVASVDHAGSELADEISDADLRSLQLETASGFYAQRRSLF